MTPAVGRSVPRVEDAELLTGRAMFLDDVDLPDALHAVFVRSQVAHGRIEAVALDAARRAPGVIGAFAATDLHDVPPIVTPLEESIYSPPRHLLARDVVRFVGEPVAVVVANTRYAGEDAAALVEVDIAPLPALPDIDTALDPRSPVLHELPSNVIFERRLGAGDTDAAFAEAAVTVERTFVHPRSTASPMEPRGVAAAPDGDGLTIWSSTQGPHNLRRLVEHLLGIEGVRVRCPDIGGGFGLKGVAYPEEVLVAWLAHRLRRPVKWVEDRVESLVASTHAREMRVTVRAAADADGRITAVASDILCDTGAYGVYPQGHVLEALGVAALIPGPYRIRNYAARLRAVATTKCPSGPYRGVGLPVATFVHERLVDVVAGELGMDRAEIRRRNLVPRDDMPYTSVTHQRYDSGDYAAALDAALARIGYDGFASEQARARAESALIGLGIACYVEWTGVNSKMFKSRGMTAIAGFDGCHIALGRDGRARAWTTIPAIGQGTATTFAQTVADMTGLELDAIEVERSDTGVGVLEGTGTFASRSAILGAGAIALAGGELKRRLLEDAAEHFEVGAEDLELVGGRVGVRGSPRHSIAVAELAAHADPERYRVSAQYDSEYVLFAYATHACRVRVDPETGALEILDYVVAEDCGRVVNPPIAEGQTHGAIAQGLGGALFEDLRYDAAAQPLTTSFMDYLLPTACDVPGISIQTLELPVPDAINGSKGIGEGGTIAPGGALANAVADALGVECNELPLTPERVRRLAQRRGAVGG